VTAPTTTTRRNEPYVEIAQDEDGKWHWQLWSGNGRAIARNSLPYESKKHVLQALATIAPAINAANAVVQVTTDK
jgi:uncharacterized protein YegP (UPF0339 family)